VAGRASGKPWQARFALGSLLLHAALLGFGSSQLRRLPARVEHAVASQPELQIEVTADALDAAPETTHAVDPAPPELGRAFRSGAASHSAPKAALTDAEAPPGDVASDGAGDADVPPSTPPSAAAPHLSLSALGVDGANPFLDRGDPAAARAAKAARVKRRLDRALAQGLTDSEVASGRGAGGPIVRSLEASVYASTVPLNGSASFILVIDSEGKLVSSALGSANGDREAWVRVARQTAQAFAGRKLHVARGQSVRLTVEVTSHLELPSGADPGVDVHVLGIPIKKGDGPRSTRIDLLDPLHPSTILSLAGDPADIGARPRRMVHAHVVSEEVL
jgi:hypothetical protein